MVTRRLVELCVCLSVWIYCTSVMATALKKTGIQMKISEVLLNGTLNTFCLKSEVTGKMGMCVYIQADHVTWEEAHRRCTVWGGHLPEDHRGPLQENTRRRMEETNVAFLTTQKRFPDGMWLGGLMLPIGDDGYPEQGPEDRRGCGFDSRNGHWGPGGRKRRAGPQSPYMGRTRRPPLPTGQPRGQGPQGSHYPDRGCGPANGNKCGTISSYSQEQSHSCDCFHPKPYICLREQDKHTQGCPSGFDTCPGSSLCYKRGDPELNWFGANQLCGNSGARLPDMERDGWGNVSVLMQCEDFRDIWSSDSHVVWTWNTTGHIIQFTNWQPGEPNCPPMDCLKMGHNGEWSAVDCKLKSNFMCIKLNSACEDSTCEVITYPDSIKRSKLEHPPPGETSKGPRDMIALVSGLVAVVVIITVILIAVCCKIRTYRRTAREMQQALRDQALYYQTLATPRGRTSGIYENDGPEYNTYAQLTPDSPGSNPDVHTVGSGCYVHSDIGNGILSNMESHDIDPELKFSPRTGSLPARPDVVPLSIPQTPTNAGSVPRSTPQTPPNASDDYYLQVFPGPYKDIKQKGQSNFIKDEQKPSDDSENTDYKESSEEDYANRIVDANDKAK